MDLIYHVILILFVGGALFWLVAWLLSWLYPRSAAVRSWLREGAARSNVKRFGSNGPPPCPRPPPPPNPPRRGSKVRIEVGESASTTRVFVDDVEQRDLVRVVLDIDASRKGGIPQVELTLAPRGRVDASGAAVVSKKAAE